MRHLFMDFLFLAQYDKNCHGIVYSLNPMSIIITMIILGTITNFILVVR